jgi:hypothetical protein
VMTTHPTSMNADLTAGEWTVREAGHVFQICVRGRMSEQRVAMTVDDLAVLITAERHRHKLEKTR